jgi:hypothetical protein
MIQVDADILLIDEVLAVGDASFQQKCFDEFNRLRDERRTILFVTHDMGSVSRYCDRAMLLEKGLPVMLDRPGPVANEYFELNFGRGGGMDGHGRPQEPGHAGDGRARIERAWFEDEHGEPADTLAQGRPCTFKAIAHFKEPVDDPALGVNFCDADGRVVFATSSIWTGERTGDYAAGERLELSVSFDVLFAPGRYYATPGIAPRGGAGDVIDRQDNAASVVVTGARASGGMVDLPHDLRIEPVAARAPEIREAS